MLNNYFIFLTAFFLFLSSAVGAQTTPSFCNTESNSTTGLGFVTTKEAYGFDGKAWQSTPITGLNVGMVGSQEVLGVQTTKEVYAFDGQKWHAQATSGLAVDLVANGGVVVAITAKELYGFDGQQWQTSPIVGLFTKVTTYNGNIVVVTTKMAYHFSAATKTWTSTPVTGLYSQSPK